MIVYTEARRGEWPFAPTTIGMERPACQAHSSGGAHLSGPPLGGTRLSRPIRNV
jgi:hypothetical protein